MEHNFLQQPLSAIVKKEEWTYVKSEHESKAKLITPCIQVERTWGQSEDKSTSRVVSQQRTSISLETFILHKR